MIFEEILNWKNWNKNVLKFPKKLEKFWKIVAIMSEWSRIFLELKIIFLEFSGIFPVKKIIKLEKKIEKNCKKLEL